MIRRKVAEKESPKAPRKAAKKKVAEKVSPSMSKKVQAEKARTMRQILGPTTQIPATSGQVRRSTAKHHKPVMRSRMPKAKVKKKAKEKVMAKAKEQMVKARFRNPLQTGGLLPYNHVSEAPPLTALQTLRLAAKTIRASAPVVQTARTGIRRSAGTGEQATARRAMTVS